MNKAERLKKAKRDLEKTLERTGYKFLKAKHGNVELDRFTDLKVGRKELPPLSDTIGNGFIARTGAKHPDAIQFPVGNSHKQGLELIYSKAYASQMNGKKT